MTAVAVAAVLASVAMATAATAARHDGKVARGHTGQGRSIRLKVLSSKAIDIKGFSIELRCSGGYVLVDAESGFQPSLVGRKGQIHETQVGSTDEVLVRGRLTAHGVRGKIRVRDRLGKHRCSSPWVPFTARVR
jgi:hypothetical protein